MTVREKFEALETVRNLREKFGSFIIGSLTEVLDIMKEIKGKPKEVFPLKIYPCGAATSRCAIRPDGWVVPCEILYDVKAGNLKNESLYDIWHNSPIMKAFREPIEIQEEEIPECKDCEYLSLCYNGHRCSPYYLPEKKFQHKELYCWKESVAGLK
jgi:radical SAM protein with 4Fe4S-binding SPASM domain